MELVIILLLICFIIWIVWKVRANVRAEKNAALDDAWRTVLSDPDYACEQQILLAGVVDGMEPQAHPPTHNVKRAGRMF
ncbi:MAG: hypothetical protein WBY84_13940, partial [Pseudolabrys sp.]